jgi:hypothetical protein
MPMFSTVLARWVVNLQSQWTRSGHADWFNGGKLPRLVEYLKMGPEESD